MLCLIDWPLTRIGLAVDLAIGFALVLGAALSWIRILCD
jgi:hypothetical protein